MILYHGSNVGIDKIDLNKCRPNKDFGRGFYTTIIRQQAIDMAVRASKRFGGEKWVTVFEYDDNQVKQTSILTKEFLSPNEEWVEFVLNNRYPRRVCGMAQSNRNNQYEMVSGPVANDDIDLSFNLFEQRFITKEILLDRLKYKKLNNQYSFHSERILQFLTRKEVYSV